LNMDRDAHGNLVIAPCAKWGGGQPPVFITAHLDHPAFVVERVLDDERVELSFRGGVMDDYFEDALITLYRGDEQTLCGVIIGKAEGEQEPFKRWIATIKGGAKQVEPGDVGVWELPAQEIVDGVLHTNACDDLAAVAAALAAMEELCLAAERGAERLDTRILFTRAEEIGFVGAIGASRDETMPMDARVIALENSRSFEDSPIGGGPIVRVGDRVSVFSPELTGAVAKVAEEIAGGPAQVTAAQKQSDAPAWRWQRKLMAGGACEASVFCAYGYQSTCVCLPLGNYHNMADLTAVQAGTNTERPRVGRECIAITDFIGMVELLVGCGTSLPDRPPFRQRIEKLWEERAFVLGS
jgi:endoglucanase